MSVPNLDTKLKILVMDGKNHITPEISDILEDGFELTSVGSFKGVISELSSNPLPWYSLIIFDSSQLSGIRNLELKITDIREQDNFVPFMVYGRGITRVISEVVRGGYDDFEGNSNLYAAKDQRGLQEELGLIFSPPIVLPNLTVVKLGGSSFDYDIDCKNRNIEEV